VDKREGQIEWANFHHLQIGVLNLPVLQGQQTYFNLGVRDYHQKARILNLPRLPAWWQHFKSALNVLVLMTLKAKPDQLDCTIS
jgi:hypothetical protein